MKRTYTGLGTIAAIALLAAPINCALAQEPAVVHPVVSASAQAVPLAFSLAEVHVSAHTKASSMNGGWLDGNRYIVRHATMVDLIAKAYGVPSRKILSGPSWLDKERYDIAAQAPADTSDDDLKGMLRSLLADRFKLVVHTENRPLPAYLVTAPDGSAKLKPSDGSGTPGCKSLLSLDTRTPGTPTTFSCHAESMPAFADFLHEVMPSTAGQEVDATGLTGLWDFTFKAIYPPRTTTDLAHNFAALESWLGLKIVASTAALPILIVDSLNEEPTPNPPGVAAVLPPPAQFAVATIKPSPAGDKEPAGHIGGGQINLTGVTMQFLINFALDLNNQAIVNAPKWLDQNTYDIVAKVAEPATAAAAAKTLPFNDEDLPQMMKKLLEDRFAFKWHMEDRPADTYVLLAVDPKLKKADPLYRTGCKEGPAPDGKDPRMGKPVLGRLISCQNMTMEQFAEELPLRSTGYIKIPMIDATGLTDAYDFVLSFSGYSQVGGFNEWSLQPPPPGGEAAVHLIAPEGGVLLFDAIEQQLGLKLEKQKHPVPALVIDHINQAPTEH